MNSVIIDGYVDEPTCLGVPPYISTYVRYVAGALKLCGFLNVDYITIDELRKCDYALSSKKNYTLAIIIAGNPVPGKYIGGEPLKYGEWRKIAIRNKGIPLFMGGPIQFSFLEFNEEDVRLIRGDIESFIFHFISNSSEEERVRDLKELNSFALHGTFIVEKHPRFPDIIVEIETGRGCARKAHCSFCIEGRYKVEFRNPEDIIAEIKALYNIGVRHFRIGKQSDLYAYGSELKVWRNGFPAPNPEWIKRLYEGIRNECTDIKTLHIDNVNPGTIANFPDESIKITEIISNYNTPGDVAALGMESADPVVIEKNFLKASPEDTMKAVQIINEIGGRRENGIPKLLPGLNIIHGLPGENKETFKKNYEFLISVKEKGLLLRRINIRQLKISYGTPVEEVYKSPLKDKKILNAIFKNYREKIRREIDIPMIKKIFPEGLVLKDLIVEGYRGDWSLARPLGSYPITVNIPKKLPLMSKTDAFVVGYRERSLVGLNHPFDIYRATLPELKCIPGISKRASEFFLDKKKLLSFLEKTPIFDKIKMDTL